MSKIRSRMEIARSGESPRGRRRGRAIAPDPIPFIDLSEEEEEEVMDPGMAWARADYQATEQARHFAEQQQLMDALVASVVESEDAEKARATKYADDLQKALNSSES